MPASDAPLPENPITRGYVRGLLVASSLLLAYCLTNILADPTGEFGLSGRFAFNRSPPPEALAHGLEGNSPSFYSRAIRESDADVIMIGASRTWRGFDTCRRPDILRIAGSAWGIAELSRVQDAVLATRSRPTTLLIEIGLPQENHAHVVAPEIAAISAALDPQTAVFAFRTLAASLSSSSASPRYVTCKPFPSPPVNWPEARRTLVATVSAIDASSASLREGRDGVVRMARAADGACRRTGLSHRVIYYSLPPGAPHSPAQKLDLLVKANSAKIAADLNVSKARAGGCVVRYQNFTTLPPGDVREQEIWRDPSQWSDYVHFQPRLGEIALRALLKR